MAVVGDRVQVPSKRVGQAPRDGVVTGVSGALVRVTWSSGEESTIMPSMGSLVVVGKAKGRAQKAASAEEGPHEEGRQGAGQEDPRRRRPPRRRRRRPEKSPGSESSLGPRSPRPRVRPGRASEPGEQAMGIT